MVNVRAVHAVLLNERMLLSAPTCTPFLSSCTNTLRVELLPLRRVTRVTTRFEPSTSTRSLATAPLRVKVVLPFSAMTIVEEPACGVRSSTPPPSKYSSLLPDTGACDAATWEIGRASCRERVCQYV